VPCELLPVVPAALPLAPLVESFPLILGLVPFILGLVPLMFEALPVLLEPLLELGLPGPEAEPFSWLPELLPVPLIEPALPAEPLPVDAPPLAPPAPAAA
jgi:hypothetical protein